MIWDLLGIFLQSLYLHVVNLRKLLKIFFLSSINSSMNIMTQKSTEKYFRSKSRSQCVETVDVYVYTNNDPLSPSTFFLETSTGRESLPLILHLLFFTSFSTRLAFVVVVVRGLNGLSDCLQPRHHLARVR